MYFKYVLQLLMFNLLCVCRVTPPNLHSRFHLAISLWSECTMPVAGSRVLSMRWTKSSATGSTSGRNVPTDCRSSIRRWTPDRRRYHSSPLLHTRRPRRACITACRRRFRRVLDVLSPCLFYFSTHTFTVHVCKSTPHEGIALRCARCRILHDSGFYPRDALLARY